MAAKKITSKTTPKKGQVKPAAKPSKPVAAAKKPAAKSSKPAPAAKKPTAKPAKTAPAAKKPAAKTSKPAPAAKKPVAKKPAAKTSKPAPAAKKPAAKTSKPAPAAKKPAAKPAAAKKKPVAKPRKPAPAAKKPTAKPVTKVTKVEPTKVEPPVKKVSKAEATPVAAPAVQVVPVAPKSRSSVVDFPAPPAPIKPPFVPPKAASAPSGKSVPAGSGGTHSPSFIQKQRQRLLDLRDELVDAVSDMARDTIRNAPEGSEASGSGQHQGDAGSDAYDRDFALSVLAKEQDALYEIEQALRRIQSNCYGVCEISSHKIPQARLEVIPFARLTVECQAQWEKEYGNRRFRPSNEVGFSGGNFIEDEDSESVSLDEDED